MAEIMDNNSRALHVTLHGVTCIGYVTRKRYVTYPYYIYVTCNAVTPAVMSGLAVTPVFCSAPKKPKKFPGNSLQSAGKRVKYH